MKSSLATAAIFAMTNLLACAAASAQVADFEVTWEDRPPKDDMVSQTRELKYTKLIDHSKRPVIGVLTEPMRGDLYRASDKWQDEIGKGTDKGVPGYVPRAHVQFLEQAGVRVIPIDYRLSKEELTALYDQLNGVYLPGDSQMAVTDETYRQAFVSALAYCEHKAFELKEHFPVFMMGNSLGTWIRSKQKQINTLTNMEDYLFTNSRVDLVSHPDDTYLFNKMTREEKQAMFNTAEFFNAQYTGLRPKDLKVQNSLKRHLRPLAVFTSHDKITNEEDKFIAIAEGAEMPIYAFTYGVELVQFFFEDATATKDQFVLDHSILARKHAQTIANLIAAEARMNEHSFDHEESVFENLIKHEELASIKYLSQTPNKSFVPLGMESHDVYILH